MQAVKPRSDSMPSLQEAEAKDFITLEVKYLQRITQDLYQRKQKFAETNDFQSLKGGVWYATDYYKALQQLCSVTKDEKLQKTAADRLEWLVNKNKFYIGLAPNSAFQPVRDPNPKSVTTFLPFVFEIKEGVTPSQALEELEKGFSILDCGLACNLAAYRALRDVITPEKFDHLFASDSPFPLRLSYDKTKPQIERLFKQVSLRSEEDVQDGDICYFSNIREYIAKNPVAEWRGLNATCIDQVAKKYVYLGSPREGSQKNEIEVRFWEECNATPVDEGIVRQRIWKYLYSNYILGHEESSRKFVASLRERTYTWEEFQNTPSRSAEKGFRTQGKLDLEVARPNLQRIEELAQTPIEQIREVFASYAKGK